MAKRFDGSGVVHIQCSEGAFFRMKLDQLPLPADYGFLVDGQRRFYLCGRSMGVDADRFRVIWPEFSNGEGSKLRSSSFTLSSTYVTETLAVLAEFLRDQGVEFVQLANKHGSRLGDVRFSGGDLAYLTGNVPHSPASHVDFPSALAPEVRRASGW